MPEGVPKQWGCQSAPTHRYGAVIIDMMTRLYCRPQPTALLRTHSTSSKPTFLPTSCAAEQTQLCCALINLNTKGRGRDIPNILQDNLAIPFNFYEHFTSLVHQQLVAASVGMDPPNKGDVLVVAGDTDVFNNFLLLAPKMQWVSAGGRQHHASISTLHH